MNTRSAEDLTRDPQEPETAPAEFLDPVVKSNDPKQLKDKALSDRAKELKDESDVRAILATEAGVRFVSRILKDLCSFHAPYWSPNYGEMSNIAGRRQVGGGIIEWVKNADLDQWFKVERELEKSRPKPKTSEPKPR